MNEWKVSVRGLVEYVHKRGSIESSFKTSRTFTEGTKAHQAVQSTYGILDQKEVFLQTEVMIDNINLKIEGRCDGLLLSKEVVTIDEIKSTTKPLDLISEDAYAVHWAQAKVYAYIYLTELNLPSINVQLTYVSTKGTEQKQFIKLFHREELELYFQELVSLYAPYTKLIIAHKIERQKSIKELPFPYPDYREGQRKLAGAVYKTITQKKDLFALAPTGIGKTISTIFPAVKAIGEEHHQRIFYVTAKTITRTAAEESFSLLQKNNLKMKVITITAKEKACLKDETICQKEYCEFADGYYDRINGAVLHILQNESLLTRGVIERYAREHKVCPFEFSLDLTNVADAVICDYNYLFDPRVNLKRLIDEHKRTSVVLIDEAHNLVDRAREMYSAELLKSPFLELKRSTKIINPTLYHSTSEINQYFIELKKSKTEKQHVQKKLLVELIPLLETFVSEAEKELVKQSMQENQELLLTAFFTVQNFLKIVKLYDDRYVTYIECYKNDVKVKLLCLDPSVTLQKMGKGFHSKVYFSATISPISYYMDLLGAGETDYSLSIPTPFSIDQTEVFIKPLSTRYQDRYQTKREIAKYIEKIVGGSNGNTLIFFPSYQYMNLIIEEMEQFSLSFKLIIQNTPMTEGEREEFLSHFQEGNAEKKVGLAVLGGLFSEGIDLKGDRLNNVIIIGVGLPQISLERNIMKEYFQAKGINGYNYAYVYPGMNKVLQAGGRLIRSGLDTGSLTLLTTDF
jgi:DNA excision repair protein ERCC-2